MEEGLVLDVREAWVVNVVAEHEGSRLKYHLLFFFLRHILLKFFKELVFFLRDPADCVFPSLLVKLAFHQNVEEVTDGCVVSQLVA